MSYTCPHHLLIVMLSLVILPPHKTKVQFGTKIELDGTTVILSMTTTVLLSPQMTRFSDFFEALTQLKIS